MEMISFPMAYGVASSAEFGSMQRKHSIPLLEKLMSFTPSLNLWKNIKKDAQSLETNINIEKNVV